MHLQRGVRWEGWGEGGDGSSHIGGSRPLPLIYGERQLNIYENAPQLFLDDEPSQLIYACWFEEEAKGLTAILCAPQVYFPSSQSQVKIRDTVSLTHQWPEGLMGSYVDLFQTSRFNFELFNAWKRNNDKIPTTACVIFLHRLNFPSTQGTDCDATSFNYENKCPIFIFSVPSSLQGPARLRTFSCQPFQEVSHHPSPSRGKMTQHLWGSQ